MQTSQKNVRLPSKTQYISQTNGFVPSNLYKQANNTATSFTTTARQTFNQNMNLNETQRNESYRASSLGNTIKPSQAKSLKNKPKQKNKRKAAAKTIGEADIEFKRSLLSGSSVSGVSSPQNFKRAFEDGEEPVKRSQPKRSVSEQKESLPGNYTAPEILYKGVFQNNYMMTDAIEVKKSTYNEIPVRKDYKYFEEQYNQEKKQQNAGFQSSQTDLENKLREYGLAAGNENIEPNPLPRRYISISDNINNSHNHFNQSFVPDSFNFEKIPGYVANRKARSEKEKSIIKIQSLIRGMITRKRIRDMKEKLKRHFNGDLEVSPYEIEFFDLNVPVFQQILDIKGENKTTAKGSSSVKENVDDDPKKKLLSNTFYSVLRSGFFPEDPMDYVVLAELQDYEDATFPKLLKEQAEKNSKEVMLAKKYEYLFGKPSVDRELKSDDKSVIKNFLKTNLASITAADLKVTKFQTDYKSIIKPKVKQDQPTYISPSPFKNNYTSSAIKGSSPVADTNKFKKFDSFATKNVEKSIQSEISEDYSNDFEEDSAIKESIYNGGKDESQSGIRESIRYSMDESKIRDSIRESIIRESIDYSSPPKKLKNRFSNKSISEDIVESYGGMGKNSSVKSIQEEIPLSESIVASRVHQKRKPSVDDDIEEDIDIKDSYGNEEFESLEESIQESIEKFQAMRKSPSPDKKEKKPSALSPRRSPEEKFSTAKPMFKKSASKDEEVSPIIPKPQSFLGQKTSNKPAAGAEPMMTSEKKETNKNLYKFSEVIPEEPAGYEEYRREERKKYLLDENLLNLPKSNTAEILFTNFQKELEKMLYMDSLTQKVGALENTIDKLYNQKEFNLLNTLQNRASSSAGFKPTKSINPVQDASESDTNNFMVYLMQKNNALERSMAALSKQMNFLINNFTGAQGGTGVQNQTTAGVPGAKAQRKPRPIIPVRKAQSLKPKTADVKKESTSPAPRVQPAAVVVQKEVQKKETLQAPAVVQTKTQPQPVKEPVKEQVKEPVKQQPAVQPQPQPIKKVEPEKKPKFAFKFASEAKTTQVEKEEEEEITLPSIKKEPEPVVKTPTPAVVEPPVSMYKSAKFGKWQQESSSEGAVEEEIIENLSEKSLPKKKEKSSEEEVDFSAKDYSESFEKLSPLTSPKKTVISKFEDKKLLTPKQDETSKYSESFEELTPTSTAKKPSPQKFEFKKQPSPKHKSEEDIDELIIDEDIDLPSDTKEEPPVVTKPVFKKAEPEQLTLPFTQPAAPVKKPEPAFEEIADDDEYGEEDFEELSLPSEEKEEETPVKVTPKTQEEKSWSEDLEASQDMSVISWQGAVWTAQEAARAELKVLEEKEKKMKEEKKKAEEEKKKMEEEKKKAEETNKTVEEKKADNVADAVVETVMQEIAKDLFPKRNPAQIEDVKSKIKHANISEQHSFDVHQDVVDQVMTSPRQEEKIEKAEEEEHHLKHYKKVEEDVKTITAKMNQAPKHQLIHIVINHINFIDPNDPKAKLSIFDKSPVSDESTVDAYNEIFLNLFRSEFRKLNTDFATTPRVQAKMEIKMAGLISRSQEILLKRIRKTTTTPEFYTTMGKNFNNIYDTLRNKKLEGEENDFYEEEEDIKRLIEEENNKLKETIADQVMESLFEETVKDLIRIAQNRKKL